MESNINNIYNFKNTIRHFINIENVKYPQREEVLEIKKLQWTKPINFRIKKDGGGYRTLKLPNILNFKNSFNYYKDLPDFKNTSYMNDNKRLVPNINIGEFETGIFSDRLQQDLENLCIYDNLIRLDIKSYYGRIYTHNINFDGKKETYLTNLNLGNTNGLIMGNYISLYFGERYLNQINEEIERRLMENNIEYKLSYFSDDFYIFCDKKDNERIINIFDSVLEDCELERNDGKVKIWTYLDYNNYHIIDKYWKKIKSDNEQKNASHRIHKAPNRLYFLNQLIYRMTKLEDDKTRRILLVSFFKSKYFYELDFENYVLKDNDYHQLCYIFRFAPEVMLYSINKFLKFEQFRGERFKTFIRKNFRESLSNPYNEEQLYYYFAICNIGYTDILQENIELVVKGNNQILISYYIKDELIFEDKYIDYLKLKEDEKYWFQNYHRILFDTGNDNLELDIKKYLIPDYAKGNQAEQSYMEFYKENIINNISFINDLDIINEALDKFIRARSNIEEAEEIELEEENLDEV